jgi:hypothetical protein
VERMWWIADLGSKCGFLESTDLQPLKEVGS